MNSVNAIHIEPNGNDTKFKNVIQNLSWNTIYSNYIHCLCKVYIAIWFSNIQNYWVSSITPSHNLTSHLFQVTIIYSTVCTLGNITLDPILQERGSSKLTFPFARYRVFNVSNPGNLSDKRGLLGGDFITHNVCGLLRELLIHCVLPHLSVTRERYLVSR
jgi:hypothetical protein